jgi:hypothetical protein
MRSLRFAALTGLALLIFAPMQAAAQGFGTIKGQAIYDEKALPKAVELKVDKDEKECLKKGPLLSEKYVVNPKNKGVRWVVVWLAKDDDGKADHDAELPVNPSLKNGAKPGVMDQPCCRFEPHVVILQKGQDFVGKNSSLLTHNMNFISPVGTPALNQSLPPNGQMTIPASKWKPNKLPVTVSCGIHPWMKGYVFCFSHPYVAVTDEDGKFEIKGAPAGKYRLMAWQEGMGWVATRNGKAITVKADSVTDAGQLPVKYED